MKPQAASTTPAGSKLASRPEAIEQLPAAPIDSGSLLQGRKEVVILHQGQHYRLQATRTGKLILIK